MLGVFRTQVLGVGSPGSGVALIIINVAIIHRPLCPGADPEKILATAPSKREVSTSLSVGSSIINFCINFA